MVARWPVFIPYFMGNFYHCRARDVTLKADRAFPLRSVRFPALACVITSILSLWALRRLVV